MASLLKNPGKLGNDSSPYVLHSLPAPPSHLQLSMKLPPAMPSPDASSQFNIKRAKTVSNDGSDGGSDGGERGVSKKDRNKRAAEKYRQKKKVEQEKSQEQLQKLQEENQELRRRIFQLETEVSVLRSVQNNQGNSHSTSGANVRSS